MERRNDNYNIFNSFFILHHGILMLLLYFLKPIFRCSKQTQDMACLKGNISE